MMHVAVDRETYLRVRPLFEDLGALQLSALAVIDGESDGRLVVDDPLAPRSALLTSPEGTFVAGDADNAAFVAALRDYVWENLFGDAGWEMLFVTTDSPGWAPRLAAMAEPRQVLRIARRHYECRAPVPDWRDKVPTGFGVCRITESILDDEGLDMPEHVGGWIRNNWGDRERFLDRGFGLATVHDRRVVSWSLADCRSGDACEIGIQTRREYRRRGLATVTAGAAVEHALAAGFRTVGWHCNEDNLGSIGTAEKVGFRLERTYETHYFYSTEAEELAERGWVAFRAGRFDETVAHYERVFALRPESPDFQYHLAARACAATGDMDTALAYLAAAVDRGWSAAEFTTSCPEFESMLDTPAWRIQLDRMG